MVQVPFLPAFHVPGKDLQSVPFRLGVEPGLPATAGGVNAVSRRNNTPIALLDVFILNIFKTSP